MNNSDSTSVLVIEPLSTIPPVVGKITSLESLREHLQWAIELEHATISIEPRSNPEAIEVLAGVTPR